MSEDHERIFQHHAAMLTAIKARNHARAAGYLRMIYQNLNFHFSMYKQISFDGLSERDVLRLLTTYVREFPDDPSGYMMLAHMHHSKAQTELVRRAWIEASNHAVKGFHFQPSVQSSVFDAEQGRRFTSLSRVGLDKEIAQELEELRNAPTDLRSPATSDFDGPPRGYTLPGEPIGIDGVSLNGCLVGFTQPTRYYFRYGFEASQLNQTTVTRNMPAGLYGRVRDTAENLFRRISANTSQLTFAPADIPKRSSAFPKLAMNLSWPFGKDRNHRDGIGVIDLLLGWNTHAQRRGRIDGIEEPATYPSVDYPWEGIDLRDARVGLWYRADDLDPKAFEPVIWIHGRTGTASFPEQDNDRCAWAVTAPKLADEFTVDGDWHTIDYVLPGTSTDWTFCGSNVEEMGEGMRRYTYAPIDRIQRDNKGGNVCVAFVGGDELEAPDGSIDLAELQIAYRSWSMLGPCQEATLISGPEEAACLTDGTLGDVEHHWLTDLENGEPIDLVWRLRGDALLTCFKIHQNVSAPAGSVAIAVSEDGETFTDVWSGTLDEVPADPAAWADAVNSNALIRVVVPEKPVRAHFVRLSILSGQRADTVGLDAFEVFGCGLPPVPSPSPFTFSEAITGLAGTGPVYAQLVAENEVGVFEGEVVEIDRPASEVPHILAAQVLDRGDEAATASIRAIGMDTGAKLKLTLRAEDADDVTVGLVRISEWHVPADNRVRIEGLEPGVEYTCDCVAENMHGRSDTFTFNIAA